MNKQDDRCVACLRAMEPALRRRFAIAVWKGVNDGRQLRAVLMGLSPGTDLDSYQLPLEQRVESGQ